MIKLQDFAKQQGVTDRQVQRLVKKYEKDLQGKFERKGPNGTWLSDEACDFLRSKMKSHPVELYDDKLDRKIKELEASKEQLTEENERLRKERDKATDDLFVAKQMILELQDQQKLLPDLEKQVEEKTKEVGILEGFIKDAKENIEELQKELAEERNKKWYQKIFRK